jgi:rhomboid-like protein
MYRKSLVTTGILIINVLVFVLWNIETYSSFMFPNFLVSWNSLEQGRYWTLLTSVFSHRAFYHIVLNMLVLSSFGPILEMKVGAKNFLIFYLVAGVFSSLMHAVTCAYLLGQPELPALGASGAVAAVILTFSLLYPHEKILLFGIIPVPALIGAMLFVGLDIWGLFAQSTSGGLPIGHGAHLGGAFIGLVYYFLFLKPKRW